MTKTHLLIPTIAALALAPFTAGIVEAQQASDTTSEATAAEEAPATEAGDATADTGADAGADTGNDIGLDTGTPVGENGAAERREPATYIKETSGDWQLQCLRTEQGEEPCQLYQLLEDGQGNSVAEVSIFKLAGGGQVEAGATFVVPLETLLTERMTIQVDGGQAKRYDYSFCTPVGCYARVGFTAQDIAQFKRGNVARVTIVPALAPDQKVTVEMSLTGFTKGYDLVTPVRQ